MSLTAITLLASTIASTAPPVLGATRVTTPPIIDGNLDDDAWKGATASDVFTQKFPDEGAAPTEPTKIRVVYDDEAIYVAFDCTQIGGPIVAPLTRRDRQIEADTVSIAFDARGDRRSAFEFWISASGTVGDILHFDDVEQSSDWDEVWTGHVGRSDHGWTAELKIPLRVLRFRGGVAGARTFGMQARRYLSRRQELDEWAYIPRAAAGEVSHYGALEGLEGLTPKSSFEARISLVGGFERRDPSVSVIGSGLSPQWGLGVDFKWHVTPILTFDGTIHPDFAQVEADQVILNLTNFEIQYPEKRPFFLEGIDVFNTSIPLLYTRRIGRAPAVNLLGNEVLVDDAVPSTIFGATKLQGELAPGWTFGSLTALTGPQSVQVSKIQADVNGNPITKPDGSYYPAGPYYDRTIDPYTMYGVFRLKRAIGDHAYVGAMATMTARAEDWRQNAEYDSPGAPAQSLCAATGDSIAYGRRCSHDAYVGSIDGRWRSAGGDYQALGQIVGTRIVGGETRTLADGTQVGDGDMGMRARVLVAKEGGKHVTWSYQYDYGSRKVDFNDLGYMRRQAMHEMTAKVGYRQLDPAGPLLEASTSTWVSGSQNLDALWLDRTVNVDAYTHYKNYWENWSHAYWSAARFDDREVGDGTALERAARVGVESWVGGDTRKPIRPSLWSNLELYSGGYMFALNAGVRTQALPQLEFSVLPSLLFTAGEPRYTGEPTLTGQNAFGLQTAASVGATLRATYTFSPRLTLQAYAQLFLAKTHFDQYSISGSSSNVVHRSDLQPLPAGTLLYANPDGEQGTLNINVVMRWEYMPGSTLFVVYTRSQVPNVTLGPTEAGVLSWSALGRSPSTDAILIKLAHWIG